MVKRSLRKPLGLLLGALGALSLVALIALTRSVNAGNGKWAPAEWDDIGTLEILTTGPEEGEHWSKLWLVVIDDQLYLRLGSRATERVERNTKAPYLSVKIAGQLFDRVRAEHVPEFRERVAEAMAKKYLSDLIIRFFPHPMTVRLTPETRFTRGPGGTPSHPSDLLRAYPKTPDRGVRIGWEERAGSAARDTAGIAGGLCRGGASEHRARSPQMARRPTGEVLG